MNWYRCSEHSAKGDGERCPFCVKREERIRLLSKQDLVKLLIAAPPSESLMNEVLDLEPDIDELLLTFANMADEPCESDSSFREFVRKNSQVAYNRRNI